MIINRPLKIVAFIHMAPPEHNAGSEVALFALLRGMVARGHSVRVIADEISQDYNVDGIKVMRIPERVDKQFWVRDHFHWADVAITHLNMTASAMRAAKDTATPLVHYVHNHNQLAHHHVTPIRAQLLMFNSQWVYERNLADGLELGPSMVVHPIVDPKQYQGERTGQWVSLISLTRSKGSEIFYELARRMPEHRFLGVKSCYGVPHVDTSLPNVFIGEHTADVNQYYARTKVILMPSDYESYGRVAVEGCCRGIPPIVHPTPGLKEALGDAAIYCDRNDIDAWQKEIALLYRDEVYYEERSAAALAFANSLRPEDELDRVEQALKAVARFGVEGTEQTVEVLGEIEYCRRAKEGGYFDPSRESGTYRPALGASMKRPDYVATRRLWMSDHGPIPEGQPGKIYLLAIPGQTIPYDRALALGLIKNNAAPEAEAKMVNGPAENKAIEGPAENKAAPTLATCAKCSSADGPLNAQRLCMQCGAENEVESNGFMEEESGLVNSAKLGVLIRPDAVAA